MPRVLILTASYGSGHNEAARALAAEFEAQGASVTVVDHFGELVHPRFARATRALYYALLRKAPAVWASAYAIADRIAADSPLTFGMTRVGTAGLRTRLAELSPDLVVTVHATPAAVMSSLAMAGERVPPHTTVVTDFVAHSQWIAPHIDRYCVADAEVRHELIARGIPSERILVTGVPVRPDFAEPVAAAAAREALGLSTRAPVVLAMAGSQGDVGRLPDVARVLAAMRRPLQGVLVAGHDPRLKATLTRLTEGTTIRTLGYVGDVRRLMAAADLLVTKAGGMTLAEAMAAETPLLLYGSLPGQERRNERFAARAGIALVARRRAELAPLLTRTLDEPDLLEQLRARMRRLRRPDASRRIVSAVLDRSVRAR
jgi:processive 1,2-diacylglycerol beta-glucosyltransferase